MIESKYYDLSDRQVISTMLKKAIALLSFLIAMKLLLEQRLPLSAAALLWDTDIDAIHVGEIGMSEVVSDRSFLDRNYNNYQTK